MTSPVPDSAITQDINDILNLTQVLVASGALGAAPLAAAILASTGAGTSTTPVVSTQPLINVVPNTWNDGLTQTIEVGSPPAGWVLRSDGYYYPPNSGSTASPIDLTQVVQISPSPNTAIFVSYVRSSEVLLPSQPYTLYNKAQNMDVLVTIVAPPGMVITTPQVSQTNQLSFTLPATQQIVVTLGFSDLILDQLPDGLNTNILQIGLSPGTIYVSPTGNNGITIGPTNPNLPTTFVSSSTISGTTPTWNDGVTQSSQVGYPPSGWTLNTNGYWYPPASVVAPPVQHTWVNGSTGQTEDGYPPANWVLSSNGSYYPPTSGSASRPGFVGGSVSNNLSGF